MRSGTIYSASDKSLNDALNQKTVTNADLRELFLTRGILISKDSSRKSLALHFSRLTHDYRDYDKLARLFGGGVHHEKMTSTRITTQVKISVFESSAHELKADLESIGASVKILAGSGNRLDVEVKYQKLQFSKSEFRQIANRVAMISIRKDGDDFVINGPHNEEAREWIDLLAKSVREKSGEKIEFNNIELSPNLSAQKKSEFFTRLIKSIDGYQFCDVSDIYVFHPQENKEDDEDDDPDKIDIGTHITKASLKGQGVLQSDELRLLGGKGFYICKIIWTSKIASMDSDLYEFEAQFASPDSCKDFIYLPRGFYKHSDGHQFSEHRTGYTKEEEYKLGKLLESAARTALTDLKGASNEED